MGSLEKFESLIASRDCLVLCWGGARLCGCGEQFVSLASLGDHIALSHAKREDHTEHAGDSMQEHFRKHFKFPKLDNPAETVFLPANVTCVLLTEHEIGATAADIKCHLCLHTCQNMDELNKHMTEEHRVSQVLVGQNITFEKPDASHANPVFFCPMINCKYHIAESNQTKHFKTFKLLKQHYIKVHATKQFPCSKCDQKFASKTYLDIHMKTCGTTFACHCGAEFQAFESLQTHCRRKAHPLNPDYLKHKPAPSDPLVENPAADKLAILQSHSTAPIPIAPKPSAMHINAAIALSELSASHLYTPKADIGIQTDPDFFKSRKSVSSPDRWNLQTQTAVSAETQTKPGSNRKRTFRPYKVSCLVQTMGEFTVKPKKARTEPGVAMGSQCRISPAKKGNIATVTSQTPEMHVDIPHWEQPDLWPLRCNTNGTQTSPRVAKFSRKLSLDSVEELAIPDLENVPAVADPTLSQTAKPPPLGQTRQFSTETQTELDIFLNSSSWCDNELPDVEKLLTTEMETQTHEGDEDLLLFANNCTQTGDRDSDFISSLLAPPFKLEYVCSAETQTSLTGFQGHNLLHQVIDQGEVGNNHIETQTQEMMELIGM